MSRMPRRLAFAATAALGLAFCVSDTASARGDGQDTTATSASATNGAVVHGVDTKLLTTRLREIDLRLVEGDGEAAARGLASLATADLSPLVEEGEGVWISAEEGTLQRAAQLAPEALVLYRRAATPRRSPATRRGSRSRRAVRTFSSSSPTCGSPMATSADRRARSRTSSGC
jgi:hypothetical protein